MKAEQQQTAIKSALNIGLWYSLSSSKFLSKDVIFLVEGNIVYNLDYKLDYYLDYYIGHNDGRGFIDTFIHHIRHYVRAAAGSTKLRDILTYFKEKRYWLPYVKSLTFYLINWVTYYLLQSTFLILITYHIPLLPPRHHRRWSCWQIHSICRLQLDHLHSYVCCNRK